MIKAVFFDLDGTLYDRDVLVKRLLTEQFDQFQPDLGGVLKDDFVTRILDLDDHGYGDKALAYREVIAQWGLDPDLAHRLVEDFWARYEAHCLLDEDVRATLEALRRQGMKLAVITNGRAQWQRQKLDGLGISSWFDTILISEAEGVRKPDREIFQRALDRCGVEACEALFVGDHPEADIEGAIQAGLTAIWKFVPYWSLTASVPTIHQLSEILPYCLSGNRREPAYTLRLAAAADAEAMVRIHHAAVHETASACYPPEVLDAWASQLTEASYERMRQELATGDGRIDVVAELNSQIVGFGMVIPEGQELRAVYVDPQFGRRGVGAAILSHLEQLAIQCGIERLDLESSLNAEAFYSRHGYQVVERGMHRFRSGHQMACVVMTKSLASIGDLGLRSANWRAPSA